MIDPIAIARDRLVKAEQKLQRLEKQAESVRSEVIDLRTTVRVMESIADESTAPEAAGATLGRQADILLMLPEGEENGAPPASLYQTYEVIGSDDISLDTFRTTLWRMKGSLFMVRDHGTWRVRGEDGKYWKEPFGMKKAPDAETSGASKITGLLGGERGFPPTTPEGSIPSRSTLPPTGFDADLEDDDPPF